MSSFFMNLDYEHQLATGHPQPKMNQIFEYLFWFVDEGVLSTKKKYSQNYLTHIQKLIGRTPCLKDDALALNWWGDLKFKEFNSKEFSTTLNQKHHLIDGLHIINSYESLKEREFSFPLIYKASHGMSGQGVRRFDHLAEFTQFLPHAAYPFIIEPFHRRIHDFSTLVVHREKKIYENLIDDQFQYKGSFFLTRKPRGLTDSLWKEYEMKLDLIMAELPQDQIYSIDSYLYEEKGEIKLRVMSEINFRKTMGYIGLECHRRYGFDQGSSAFFLSREKPERFLKREEDDWRMWSLSPGDCLFETYFLSAKDDETLFSVLNRSTNLLPQSKLSVLI